MPMKPEILNFKLDMTKEGHTVIGHIPAGTIIAGQPTPYFDKDKGAIVSIVVFKPDEPKA